MILNKVQTVYFSPTRTSKQVAEAIVRGMGAINQSTIDLTLETTPETILAESDLLILVVPVYGGHVAPLAMERLQAIRGTNTPAVLVVVYGNRAYEKALGELDLFAEKQGFKVVAAATFIGEHSYSNDQYPIALNRPSLSDLDIAMNFGKEIVQKVTLAESIDTLYPIDVTRIQRPRQPFFSLVRFLRQVIKLRKSGMPLPRTPWVEEENLCQHCGLCAKRCPAKAIAVGDELHTDETACIKCCACVKVCPHQARVYRTPFAKLLSRYFTQPKDPKTMI